MPESNVVINWKTGDPQNDRHIERYRRCLFEFVRELEEIPEADDILAKYFVLTSTLNHSVNLDFPDDFDQSILPEELR